VTAVEPDAQMVAELRRRQPDVPAAVGRAEAIPLPDDSVDAVLVGTAFHWFDTDRALPEIARVLRPGGVLATLYNQIDDSVPWVAELDRLSRTACRCRRGRRTSPRRTPASSRWSAPGSRTGRPAPLSP